MGKSKDAKPGSGAGNGAARIGTATWSGFLLLIAVPLGAAAQAPPGPGATGATAVPAAPAPTVASVPDPVEEYRALRDAESRQARRDFGGAAQKFLDLWRRHSADGSLELRAAECYLAAGRRGEALPLLEAACAGGWDVGYDISLTLARTCSQLDQKDQALAWIERALEQRHPHRPGIAGDPAFTPLRDDPRFKTLTGRVDTAGLDRAHGWALDLDWYEAEVLRLHAHPDQPARGEPFRSALGSLRRAIPGLDDAAVALELQRITALLSDGHSTIYPLPTSRIPFPVLPIRTYVFADGIFIVEGTGEGEDLGGCEVEAIGGRSAADLLAATREYVSRDNEMAVRWMGPLVLRDLAFLRHEGATQTLAGADLVLRDRLGAERRVHLAAVPTAGALHGPLAVPPGTDAETTAPWLARAREPFWMEEHPDDDLLYVQVNQIGNAAGRTLAQFAGDVREALRATEFGHLVLDLRHNGGGNNFLIWPLVRAVAWFEEESPDHRTYVITGRNTFSACQNLVNQLARATSAILVGEPSSSKPNFTGESTELLLPWSGMTGSISSRWWQDSYPEDRRPFIPVELPVELTAKQWLANEDPCIAAIQKVIAEGL